jgi:hypothetical protein
MNTWKLKLHSVIIHQAPKTTPSTGQASKLLRHTLYSLVFHRDQMEAVLFKIRHSTETWLKFRDGWWTDNKRSNTSLECTHPSWSTQGRTLKSKLNVCTGNSQESKLFSEENIGSIPMCLCCLYKNGFPFNLAEYVNQFPSFPNMASTLPHPYLVISEIQALFSFLTSIYSSIICWALTMCQNMCM